ncbi:MAG: molybdopterin molybdotransferase MoeA [Anaerolineae bacterium]|nr:molybdopterin molybdotransferase MoeA [Anaerolineae bacterium]NUQ04195.1 molybdopterin molybdotransferase MoeA [Anaerolineae bacterium]
MMNATPEFFNVQPVETALASLFALWEPARRAVMLDVRESRGKVLAAAAVSPIDLPEFRRSTVDGYAVRAADTFGASQSLPAYLTCVGSVPMGAPPTCSVALGQAVEIFTGGMLPDGADAVVMVERTQALGTEEIEVLAPVAPGENVIQVGEDVRRGEPILPVGHRLRAQDVGGLLAVGVLSVEVIDPPRVGILCGGDELIPPEVQPQPGQIRDINAYTLAGLVEAAGGTPLLLGIGRDDFEDYYARAETGLRQVDVLVMTSGSSISTRDLTRAVIERLGAPGVIQHGLAVKPGKPTLIGLCEGKPVIGLPGNPVSALLVARQILVPVLRRALGEAPRPPAVIHAALTANIASTSGREDTVPVRLFERDGTRFAEPVFGKSNLIYTLLRADGLVQVPLNSGGIRAGALVEVMPFDD